MLITATLAYLALSAAVLRHLAARPAAGTKPAASRADAWPLLTVARQR